MGQRGTAGSQKVRGLGGGLCHQGGFHGGLQETTREVPRERVKLSCLLYCVLPFLLCLPHMIHDILTYMYLGHMGTNVLTEAQRLVARQEQIRRGCPGGRRRARGPEPSSRLAGLQQHWADAAEEAGEESQHWEGGAAVVTGPSGAEGA